MSSDDTWSIGYIVLSIVIAIVVARVWGDSDDPAERAMMGLATLIMWPMLIAGGIFIGILYVLFVAKIPRPNLGRRQRQRADQVRIRQLERELAEMENQ